jgi:hypothetical protein
MKVETTNFLPDIVVYFNCTTVKIINKELL